MTSQWHPDMTTKYTLEVSRIEDQVRDMSNNIDSRAGAVALGIQDAQNDVARMKSTIESGINTIQTRVNELTSIYQAMTAESAQATNRVNALETEVNSTQKAVKEAETLAALRKEQADELRKKNEGNYHSSWMGLWRPLSEQSRIGLLIASIFFGLLALALLFLYGKQFLPGTVLAYFSAFGFENGINFNAIAGTQGGGRRRK